MHIFKYIAWMRQNWLNLNKAILYEFAYECTYTEMSWHLLRDVFNK